MGRLTSPPYGQAAAHAIPAAGVSASAPLGIESVFGYALLEHGCDQARPPDFVEALETKLRAEGIVNSGGTSTAEEAFRGGRGMYWRLDRPGMSVVSVARRLGSRDAPGEMALTLTFASGDGGCGTRWHTLGRRTQEPRASIPSVRGIPSGVAADDVPAPPFAQELFRGGGFGTAGELRLYSTGESAARTVRWFREVFKGTWIEQLQPSSARGPEVELLWFVQGLRYCLVSIVRSNFAEHGIVVVIGTESIATP